MLPFVKLQRESGMYWTERRMYGLRVVRRVTGSKAGALDVCFVKRHGRLPLLHEAMYVPYTSIFL